MENLQNWSLEMRKLSSVKRSPFIYQKDSRISLLVPLSWQNPYVLMLKNEDLRLKPFLGLESVIALRDRFLDISLYHFSTGESFVITMPVRLWEMAHDIIIPLKTSRVLEKSSLYLILMLCPCIARSSYVKVQSMHSPLGIEV